MRKLKITSVILCITILFTVAFTGCHGGKETASFTVPETFDTSKNYEITFWAKNDTNRTQVDIYEKAIEEFESYYPNIHVILRTYTDYNTIYNDVITNIATGTTPNVCVTYPDHIATYITGENTVVPLDSLFTNEKYGFGGSEIKFDGVKREEMVEKFLEECKIGDTYYAIPYMRSTEACYINKTYVEKLGYTLPETLTWDFIWEVSEAATAKDEDGNYIVNGQKTMIPFIYKSTDNMMIQYLNQAGAGYADENGNIYIENDTTTQFLYEIASHVKTGAFSTFKKVSYPANFLNAGQCIFAIDSTAGSTWMGSNAPLLDISEDKIVEFETVVMTIPQLDTENPSMISQGPSICIFNKEDSQEVLASWLFAQFLLTNDVQISYSQTEGYVPVTTKAQTSAEYTDYLSRSGEDNSTYYNIKIDAVKILLENTENTFVTPVFNGSASLRDAAGKLIEDAVLSISRKITYDDAHIANAYDTIVGDIVDSADVKSDLGPLPKTAVILLVTLVVAWVLIAAYYIYIQVKIKKKQSKI